MRPPPQPRSPRCSGLIFQNRTSRPSNPGSMPFVKRDRSMLICVGSCTCTTPYSRPRRASTVSRQSAWRRSSASRSPQSFRPSSSSSIRRHSTPWSKRQRAWPPSMPRHTRCLFDHGVECRSRSSAGAPILFVKKKDGSLRLCVDYRGLNSVTIKNRYPVPLIDQLLIQLGSGTIFTKIDLRSAYNQVRIREGDEWKTAFRTPYGLFEYLVMPFGLANAPASFQYFMNETFKDFLDVFVVIYLDDILIYSSTPEDHERHVRLVLHRLRTAQLHAKLEKCVFNTVEVEFLGFLVSSSGIRVDPSRIDCILSWQQPTDVHGVQVFLGFANFYRKFVPHFAELALPLTNLTRDNVPFRWDQSADAAFTALKVAFTSAPVLAHFDPDRPCEVETDASDFAVAMVLSQRGPDDELHPLAFFSRKLAPTEINFPIYDKELLAVVQTFEKWRQFLDSSRHQTVIHSDHRNLEYFTSTHKLNRRQVRWSQLLNEFDFVIQHRPGRLHGKADALTRRPEYAPSDQDEVVLQQSLLLLPASRLGPGPLQEVQINVADTTTDALLDRIRRNQASDPFVCRTRQRLHRPSGRHFSVRDDVLYRGHSVVVSGDDCKLDILRSFHDNVTAGHLGIRKTVQLIRREFWWPGLTPFVARYVLSCDTCRRTKTARHKPFGLLMPLPLPTTLWRSISMDFVVKLPCSNGYDSILVVVDRLSKMAHFIPCNETISSVDLAALFLANIFRLHGLPDDIVSDRGPQFIAKFWKQLLIRLGVQRNLSSSRHPESDGQTERVNQVMEQYLRAYVNYLQDDWQPLLAVAEFSYNNADHTATGMSPFFANYGYHPRVMDVQPRPSTSANPTADERAESLQRIRNFLTRQLTRASADSKRFADAKRQTSPKFQVGDLVMLRRGSLKTLRPCAKLDYQFLGPFPISQLVNPVAFQLDLPAEFRIHNVFHVSQLEPYVTNLIPGRTQPPPPPILLADDDAPLFIVHDVLDSRYRRSRLEYLIDWEGYPPSERTWEPAGELHGTGGLNELLVNFHARYPTKPGPKWRKPPRRPAR